MDKKNNTLFKKSLWSYLNNVLLKMGLKIQACFSKRNNHVIPLKSPLISPSQCPVKFH